MKFLNLFSLVLLFVWQVSAGQCTGRRENANSNKLPDDKSYVRNSLKISEQKSDSPPSYASLKKLTNQLNDAPPSYDFCMINLLNRSNLPSDISQIEVDNIKYYSYDDNTKTLTMNGVNLSTETSMSLDAIQSNLSKLSIETITLKNLFIGYATFKEIAEFSNCYQNTFNTLIIDSCQFASIQSIEFIQNSLPKVKKLKIINCLRILTFDNFLNYFKDTLEELVIEECHFSIPPEPSEPFNPSIDFTISSNLKLTNLKCAKLIRCILHYSTLKNILTLFPSELETLELSHLSKNGQFGSDKGYDDPFFSEFHLILDFLYLNVNRFTDLKKLAVKKNGTFMTEFKFEKLENFECTGNILNGQFQNTLKSNFKTLSNLKRIKIKEFTTENFDDISPFIVNRKIIVDINDPIYIVRDNLPSISSILSTFTNVHFCMRNLTADDIKSIYLGDASNFKDLNKVTFSFKHADTNDIAFMNLILTSCHDIRTITIIPFFENITAGEITRSCNEIKNYDKIENVNFSFYSLYFESLPTPTPATCEFIIRILKQVPNLKYLSFENMPEYITKRLFNRLKKCNLVFPNLKRIKIDYNGPISILVWFIESFAIEELDIKCPKLKCDSSKLLDKFTNETLKKLRIENTTINNSVRLKKWFRNMVNLKELHILNNPYLINVLKNNSTIEMVGFECYLPDDNFENIFAILKTFIILKCVSITLNMDVRNEIIDAFNKHLEGKGVELTFRIGVH